MNKVTVPTTSTEAFDLLLDAPPFGGPDIPFQLAGGGSRTFTNLVPGLLLPYRITEEVPPGWALSVTGSQCVQQGNSVFVFPIPFVATTCTFTNTATSTITIDKTAVGADGRFDFTEATLGPRSVDTVNGSGSVTYTNVAPGTYDFGEVVPEGWQAGPFGGACAADGTITVTGNAPTDLRCTITNTRQAGSVTFTVNTIGGDPDTPFVINVTGAPVGSEDIPVPTSGGTGSVTRALPVGEYALLQPPKFGWANGTISCVPATEPPAPPAVLTVTPGTSTTCTVSNTKLASLVIRTVTSPAGQAGTFALGASSGLSPAFFALGDGQVQRIDNITPNNLAPNPVAVNEVVPAGWSLATSGTGCTPTTTGITISPVPGAVITCTFTNTLVAPVIAVSPSEVPPGGTIVIDVGGLPPGQTVGIEILDENDRIVGTFVLVVGPDGQVQGNFAIPSGYPPGRYSARVVGPGFPPVTQTFAVSDPSACPLCITAPAHRPVTSGVGTPLVVTGGDGVDLGTVGLFLIGAGSVLVAIGRRQRYRERDRGLGCIVREGQALLEVERDRRRVVVDVSDRQVLAGGDPIVATAEPRPPLSRRSREPRSVDRPRSGGGARGRDSHPSPSSRSRPCSTGSRARRRTARRPRRCAAW